VNVYEMDVDEYLSRGEIIFTLGRDNLFCREGRDVIHRRVNYNSW